MTEREVKGKKLGVIPLFLGKNSDCVLFKNFKVICNPDKETESVVTTQFPIVAKSNYYPHVYFVALESDTNVKTISKKINADNPPNPVKLENFNILDEQKEDILLYEIINNDNASKVYDSVLKYLDIGLIINKDEFISSWKFEEFEKNIRIKQLAECLFSYSAAMKVLNENMQDGDDITKMSYICLMSLVYDLNVTVLANFDFKKLKDRFIYYNFIKKYDGPLDDDFREKVEELNK